MTSVQCIVDLLHVRPDIILCIDVISTLCSTLCCLDVVQYCMSMYGLLL